MGSGASSSTFNEEECRIVCGEMFDAAKFKELKDSRGRVTLQQLNDQKLATQGEEEEKEKDASEKPSTKKWSASKEQSLGEMRDQLKFLQENETQLEEGMAEAANNRRFTEAGKWKVQMALDAQRVGSLKSEISLIEAQAWEPVTKGSTILFYYNWATGESKKSELRPAFGDCRYAAVRSSFNLGANNDAGSEFAPRASDGAEKHLWGILKQRSSTVRKFSGSWRECFDDDSGYSYYYNSVTGVSQWEKPSGLQEALKTTDENANRGSDLGDQVDQVDDAEIDDSDDPPRSDKGWEAITNPDGGILYYYNYVTGEWTYSCPESWDRETFVSQTYSQPEPDETTLLLHQELAAIVRSESENMEKMKEMLKELKVVIEEASEISASAAGGKCYDGPAVEASLVSDAVFATRLSEADARSMFKDELSLGIVEQSKRASKLFDRMCDAGPEAFLGSLERDHAEVFKVLQRNGSVDNLKQTLSAQSLLESRRSILLKSSSEVSEQPTQKSKCESTGKKHRSRIMSVKPDNVRDAHMWGLLIKGSTCTGTLETGAKTYRHDKSGQCFSFDDETGGSFQAESGRKEEIFSI